jgi:serine/threonine protein kinase
MNSTKQIEDAIFYTAASISDAEQRGRYLDQSCAGDPNLRAVVDKMLARQAAAESFFAASQAALSWPQKSPPMEPSECEIVEKDALFDEQCGARVGRYKLIQIIGEGGCGVVYMAEQEEPVKRRVALKIIKLGMDTKSVIARFDAERQALAMMDHPNIARVLDAGATETGRPFFVMELVHGIKITEFCDANNLGTVERLNLFIDVCNAIQHAHQKGVIHRDIKPSNILVALHDGNPVPKVIDFGIAKATEGRLTDKTLVTMAEQIVGTPAYMSPEQAEMSGLDVDTRSDVYSLGVLLYELLTGKTPFNQDALMKSGLSEMRRKLREDEPQKPSTVLTSLHKTELCATAQRRHVEPPRLISALKGDLDWIVMKALEKDRARRYETVNGLALDVGRYINNEPVVARPPSRLYLLQKAVKRNRTAVLSGVAVALALIIGLGAATAMYFRERQARQEQARLREQAEAKEQINQAAINVSQDKFEEANQVLSQVKILPKQPSFDGVLAYRRVGEWLAMRQRWAESAARFSPLMEIDRLDTWQVVTLDYQACGVLLAECKQREAYDQFCVAAIERFRGSTNGDLSGRILKTCLLFPCDEKMLARLKPMFQTVDRFFSRAPKDRFPGWPTIILALWEYRNGNFDAAQEWCKRGLNREVQVLSLSATLQSIQAMALFRQGQPTPALEELNQARLVVKERFEQGLPLADSSSNWYDWLFARVLLKEAESVVEGGNTSPFGKQP